MLCVHLSGLYLSCKHVLACLRFAQRYENWTIVDWKRMNFSDETKNR